VNEFDPEAENISYALYFKLVNDIGNAIPMIIGFVISGLQIYLCK